MPTLEFALKVEEDATPDAFVVVVNVVKPPENVPLAPELGAINVTEAPLTGVLDASVTVTTSKLPNAVLITALCGVPLVAVTVRAGGVVVEALNVARAAPQGWETASVALAEVAPATL